MKTFALLLVLVMSWAPVGASAGGFPFKNRRLAEFALTPREYDNLNFDQKISYVKFLLNFAATVEDMQNIPTSEKHALLDSIGNVVALLEPVAFADGAYKQEGATCIHSLEVSHYVRKGNYLVCAPPSDSSSTGCPSGQVGCGSAFSSLVTGTGGGLCIAPPAAGAIPGHTALCVQKISSLVGVDAKLAAQAQANSTTDKAHFTALMAQMKTALQGLEDNLMPNQKLSLHDYCANGNQANGKRQAQECEALNSLNNVFNANVTLGLDACKPGTLKCQTSPKVDQVLAQAQLASDHCKGAPVAFNAKLPAGQQKCLPVKPTIVAKPTSKVPASAPPAQDSLAGGAVNENGNSANNPSDPGDPNALPDPSTNVSDPGDPNALPDPSTNVSDPGDPNALPDPSSNVSDPGDPNAPPETYTPPVVTPPPTHHQNPPPSDCMSYYQPKLGVLACVACGLQGTNDAEIRVMGGGVSKWLALLGAMAQTEYGPFNSGENGEFQERVAEMVADYGYCTNKEYPDNPGSDAAGDSIRRGWVEGHPPLSNGSGGGNNERQFAATFGLMSDRKGGFLGFGSDHPANWDRPMTYARGLFYSPSPHGFDDNSSVQEQWRFRGMLAGQRRTFPHSGFAQCAAAIENRLTKYKSFKSCEIVHTTPGHHRYRPPEMTETEWKNNESLYQSMIKACHITKERPPRRKCHGNQCVVSSIFPSTSTTVPFCDPLPDPPVECSGASCGHCHDGNCGGTPPPGNPPPNNGGEPSTPRGTYGGEAESKR